GHFKGLCVRGGGEVDAEWSNGIIRNTVLRANVDNTFHLKIPGTEQNKSDTQKKTRLSEPV
ncbi:hypothetical protein EZS27_035729, partial [termite gut metagenome]